MEYAVLRKNENNGLPKPKPKPNHDNVNIWSHSSHKINVQHVNPVYNTHVHM